MPLICSRCGSRDTEIIDHIIYCNECTMNLGNEPIPKRPKDIQIYADLKAKITGNEYDWCEQAREFRTSGQWEELFALGEKLIEEAADVSLSKCFEYSRLLIQLEIWETYIEETNLNLDYNKKINVIDERRKTLRASI